MSVRISIYDFFAYTIPGGLYLFTIAYACTAWGLLRIDWLTLDLSIAQIVMAAGLAYIAGLILDPVVQPWYHLFKPKNLCAETFQEFQRRHPSLQTTIQPGDWAILLAQIRRESIDLALDLERHNATNVMLRNVSVGLMILSLVEVTQLARGLGFLHLVLAVVLAGASVVAVRESVKFGRWFFLGVFETIASRSLEASSLVVWKQAVPAEVEDAAGKGQAEETCGEGR